MFKCKKIYTWNNKNKHNFFGLVFGLVLFFVSLLERQFYVGIALLPFYARTHWIVQYENIERSVLKEKKKIACEVQLISHMTRNFSP